MTIQASNDCVWVVREIPESEKSGIMIPDSAKKPVHRGKIVSIGDLVSDKKAKQYDTAIFNRSAGFDIEEAGVTYTILRQIDIVGYDNKRK